MGLSEKYFVGNMTAAYFTGKLNISSVNGSGNYEKLSNKPRINGVELLGDRSFSELGFPDIPDMTGYARLSDIPSSLPANGGDANTVGGKSLSSFIYPQGYYASNVDDIKYPYCGSVKSSSKGIPVENGSGGTVVCFADGTGSYVQLWTSAVFEDQSHVPIYIRHFNGTKWSNWGKISTTPIKSTVVSGTTDVNGYFTLWGKGENKIPIAFSAITYPDLILLPMRSTNWVALCANYAIVPFKSSNTGKITVYYIEA